MQQLPVASHPASCLGTLANEATDKGVDVIVSTGEQRVGLRLTDVAQPVGEQHDEVLRVLAVGLGSNRLRHYSYQTLQRAQIHFGAQGQGKERTFLSSCPAVSRTPAGVYLSLGSIFQVEIIGSHSLYIAGLQINEFQYFRVKARLG